MGYHREVSMQARLWTQTETPNKRSCVRLATHSAIGPTFLCITSAATFLSSGMAWVKGGQLKGLKLEAAA